ncbi:ABC1K1 [Symbiodinium sp. CCMP2592]|nr:ABC1K1 [Symbiodinium sp. CCMP2592]
MQMRKLVAFASRKLRLTPQKRAEAIERLGVYLVYHRSPGGALDGQDPVSDVDFGGEEVTADAGPTSATAVSPCLKRRRLDQKTPPTRFVPTNALAVVPEKTEPTHLSRSLQVDIFCVNFGTRARKPEWLVPLAIEGIATTERPCLRALCGNEKGNVYFASKLLSDSLAAMLVLQASAFPRNLAVTLVEDVYSGEDATTDGASDIGWREAVRLNLLGISSDRKHLLYSPVQFRGFFRLPPYGKVLIGAITHVSNSDYQEIANDFIRLGFLRPGTDVSEIVPAMETIWADSMGKSIRDFNFRTVTARFSKLVYQFPIRIPERFSLVFRSLLMQEGICLCLNPDFSILEVALPYASKRLLSNPNPSLRRELLSIVFREGPGGRPVLQWDRVTNLVSLAKQARDGTSIQLNEVIVDFFRGLRRDVLSGDAAGFAPSQVLRSGLEALVAGDRLRLRDVLELVELLSPDLTPDLAREVADALIRDSVEDVFRERGVRLRLDDLRDPRRITEVLRQPQEILKLLPVGPGAGAV